jgi:hypothetical protein
VSALKLQDSSFGITASATEIRIEGTGLDRSSMARATDAEPDTTVHAAIGSAQADPARRAADMGFAMMAELEPESAPAWTPRRQDFGRVLPAPNVAPGTLVLNVERFVLVTLKEPNLAMRVGLDQGLASVSTGGIHLTAQPAIRIS